MGNSSVILDESEILHLNSVLAFVVGLAELDHFCTWL